MELLKASPNALRNADSAKSPYVLRPTRLADVIAAIQVMAVYKFYKTDFAGWANRIVGDRNQADYWKNVFLEHPEFFRLDSTRTKASLVWRRQFPRTYQVDLGRDVTPDELQSLSKRHQTRISRRPLSPDDVGALMTTAVELHTRALEHHREHRRWVDLLVAVCVGLAGMAGAVFGGYLSGL